MRQSIQLLFLCFFAVLTSNSWAGNPDRQGEAGAGELLFNPWAKSAGLHSLTTSSVTGVEAMRLNIAGLSRIVNSELIVANTRLYEGTDINLNAIGFAIKQGSSAFGVSLMSVNFGDIPITTTAQPEGTGGFYSPNFFHIGLGYSYTYENKIAVGILVRGISEAITNVSAFGFAIDAGVQYVTGENDNFKLGISLRNVGSPMKFNGEGLSFEVENPGSSDEYRITFDSRAENFELPSALNIGISYDFILSENMTLRTLGNFTSNSFSRDEIGGGAELFIKELITVRAGYRLGIGNVRSEEKNVYSGFAAGFSLNVPVSRENQKKVGLDYAFRATNPFQGTHNFSVRLSL